MPNQVAHSIESNPSEKERDHSIINQPVVIVNVCWSGYMPPQDTKDNRNIDGTTKVIFFIILFFFFFFRLYGMEYLTTTKTEDQ